MSEINTSNDFWFSVTPVPTLIPSFPPIIRSKQQAFRTAVWLIAFAEGLPDEEVPSSYEEIKKAIHNS